MDDRRICQTSTATPAEPGDLLWEVSEAESKMIARKSLPPEGLQYVSQKRDNAGPYFKVNPAISAKATTAAAATNR
jgi:hypothetical protein